MNWLLLFNFIYKIFNKNIHNSKNHLKIIIKIAHDGLSIHSVFNIVICRAFTIVL
ncbi:hypothetical protein MTsPCn9_01150 [Croceitalea sp. MTPC9]|nr:hypothetical protein MTsPCn6_07560 [Croceitalea sp. MTPC6]GMN15179.1 hypothetical protein MTsPCn9_01150 [Croceitalea sp. MTPC9]